MPTLKAKFNRVAKDNSQLQEFTDKVCDAFDNGNGEFKPIEISATNLEDGIGEYSLQQKAANVEHVKGGLALGNNSVAFGLGDSYSFNWSVNGTTLTTTEIANPNWQNMVLKYGDEYRRILSVDISNKTITIDNVLSVTSGTIAASIINQVALGEGSFVWGEYNQSFGKGSMAGGLACKAVGDGSFAGGTYSLTNQSYGIAYGEHVISAGVGQAVFGKYNAIDFNSIFIVGYGSSDNDRKNALYVDQNGYLHLTKNPESSSAGTVVTTKSYVDGVGHKINIKGFSDTVNMTFILITKRTTAYSQTDLYNYFVQGQTLPDDTYVYTLGNGNNNKSYYLGIRSGSFRIYEHDLPNQLINRSILTSFSDTIFSLAYD